MTAEIVTLKPAVPPTRLQCIRSAVNAAARTMLDCQRKPGFCSADQMTRVLIALGAAVELIDTEIAERGEK